MDDLISRSALLAAYDKAHQGPPGGARKLIEEAPDAIVRCRDCVHRPTDPENKGVGQSLEFPDDVCPCQIGDNWYSWMPKDDWFCADGERSDKS